MRLQVRVSALPASGRSYDRWRPHTFARLASRVGSATSVGQLSEGGPTWWPGHHLPYHSSPSREDLLEVPDKGAEDKRGLGNLNSAGADPTEQELGNLNGTARADLTEHGLGNSVEADPTERGLGNLNGAARADLTEHERGNCYIARVDPIEQELGNWNGFYQG
ncbi:hypothetical protein BHM03_00043386 [Ensete ventricosum]|nr:hypothetical protein BHM03_00043386 [Ensete ventricosum]